MDKIKSVSRAVRQENHVVALRLVTISFTVLGILGVFLKLPRLLKSRLAYSKLFTLV